MPPDMIRPIIKEVEENVTKSAQNRFGCRIVQRLLEHCPASQLEKQDGKAGIIPEIHKDCTKLSTHKFGNYVVQHMLEHGRCEDKRKIIQTICADILSFSKDRCSSNVVEKCIEVSTQGEHACELQQEWKALLTAVMFPSTSPPLHEMIDDRFGTFIVLKLAAHCKGKELEMLRNRARPKVETLQKSSNGKQVLQSLYGTTTFPSTVQH
jgi:hypothetical protein